MKKILVFAFMLLLSLFTAVILSSALLGILNAYTPAAILVLSGTLFIVVSALSLKYAAGFFLGGQETTAALPGTRLVNHGGYAAGLLIAMVLLLLPLAFWPLSGINPELAWDAGAYHLPKAAELVVSHSLLDLTISYGEYPSGYESLVALSLVLNRDGYLIGVVHALVMVFFLLGTFLLARRYSSLPEGVLFFVVVFVFASYDLIRFIESNPFAWVRLAGFTIGKNDFLLSALIIALLAFSPAGPKDQHARHSLTGMALTGFLICATKPNGLLIVAVLFALAIGTGIKQTKTKHLRFAGLARRWILTILFVVAGLWWAARNYLVNGKIFSQDILEIQDFSIINNLFNPFFYRHLGLNLHIALIVFVLCIIAAVAHKRFHWSIPLVYGVLLLGFSITPSTAFWGSTDKPAEVAWRFGVHLLVFMLPVLLLMIDPVFMRILKKWPRVVSVLSVIIMAGVALAGSLTHLDRLKLDTDNSIVLRDQYREAVGTGGYFSAYDFIRKTVSNSIVWAENGMPFYVFGEGLTNSISRATPPDYWVFLQTPWVGPGGFPEKLDTPEFAAGWKLVYQDAEGRVYKNKARE